MILRSFWVAEMGAILTSAMRAVINLPLVARVAKDRMLMSRIAWALGGIVLLGAVGAVAQSF
ncbi:MAG TPA: hypothetical protein VH985_20100 [Candidatus Binatia bacterium]